MLVTTAGRLASPDGERVVRLLGRNLETTFAEVESHVPVPLVQQAVLQARRDAVDVVVSFGGGSCADLGKAVCFFLEQEAGMPGATHLDRPVLPHVSIPTTYSGAELTPFFGMTDPATRQKQGAGGPTSVAGRRDLRPRPHRVHPAPRAGRDGHERAGPLRGGGLLAAPHAGGGGHRAGRRAHDPLARCPRWSPTPATPSPAPPCSRAPRWPAAACSTPGMGVHHGLSQLVGGRTGIPHGLANAILLTHSIAFNAETVPDEVGRLSGRARRRGGRRRRRPARGHRAPGAAVGGRRGRGRPRGGGPAVAVERQRRPQPAAGVRGRRAGHPPSRLLTSLPWRGCAAPSS